MTSTDSAGTTESKAELERARGLLDQGNLQESSAAYRRVVALSIDAAQGHYGLGVISLRRGDVTTAEAEFLQCVDYLNTHVPLPAETREAAANAYYYLGDIWDKRGVADAATGFYRKAIEINPDHRGAHERVQGRSPIGHSSPQNRAQDPATAIGARARLSDTVPLQAGVYAYLQQDSSPLARQSLQLIDALDGLGMLKPRLSAYLGPIAWRIFALFLVPFLLLPLFDRALLVRRISPSFVLDITFVVELLIAVSLIHYILKVVTFRVRFDKGRLRIAEGILRRTESNNELYRIEDIRLYQTMLNRVTGDGRLILSVAGGHGGVRTVNLGGIAKIDQLRRIADQLRNVVLLLRTGQFGKGVIY